MLLCHALIDNTIASVILMDDPETEFEPSVSNSSKRRPVSLLACIYCRHKHLKCDANVPTCSRCSKDDRACEYIASRRGYKSSKIGGGGSAQVDTPSTTGDAGVEGSINQSGGTVGQDISLSSSLQIPLSLFTDHWTPLQYSKNDKTLTDPKDNGNAAFAGLNGLDYDLDHFFDDNQICSNRLSPSRPTQYGSDRSALEPLVQSYYIHFHSAHPILLPFRSDTIPLIQKYPNYLKATMQYIGSQYEAHIVERDFHEALCPMLLSQTKNGYLVQAMVISTIMLHAQNEQQQAKKLLGSAIDLAIALGMHRNSFAPNNSEGSSLLEESWRRTWWELYIMDGMLAALHQENQFRLHSIDSDLLLPCEERDYGSGEVSFLAE